MGADRPGNKGGGRAPRSGSGDMPTRLTGRPACRAEGIAMRAAWLTCRHLAASRGHDAEVAFWPRLAREDSNTRDRAGSDGWRVGVLNEGPRFSTDTALLSSCARGEEARELRARRRSPRTRAGARFPPPPSRRRRRPEELTALCDAAKPAGPVSLLVPERACVVPAEDRRSRAKRDTEEPRLVGATRRLRRIEGARAPGILHEPCRGGSSAGDHRRQHRPPWRGDGSDGAKRRRTGSASLHRGRSTSPTTEDVAHGLRGRSSGRK